LKDVNGYIVYDEPVGGIQAIMIPLIKEIIWTHI
jgi:hypothetical protein